LSTVATVWFALPDGSYATTEKGPVDQNLKDRDYFPKLLAGHDTVGNLVVGKTTGLRSIIVATPVIRQGQVIGVIGVSLNARSVSQLVIDRVGMPDSLTFYALDPHGQTAIHKDPAQMFQYPSDMGDQSLKSAVQIMLLQPKGMVNYQFAGIERKAIFDTSELTGWHFVLVQLAK
jgi:methyl-accepting chemotaxis protein